MSNPNNSDLASKAADAIWIGGDGGPLIVLQDHAAQQWQGASVLGDSDYLAILAAEDYVIQRYSRDMIVLEDSESGTIPHSGLVSKTLSGSGRR